MVFRDWSTKLLEASSMNISQMPNVCEGTDQTGIIKKDIADKYGFNMKCRVYGGAGDNAVAAVGLGLYEEGDASISLGTSGVIFGQQRNLKIMMMQFNFAIVCQYLHLMSVMLSCTSNINWFINTLTLQLMKLQCLKES